MRLGNLAITLACALLAAVPTPCGSSALPSLPIVFIDTAFTPPSGSTITVNAGGNLQAALNNAQPGDTIVLQAGATFAGPFTLPGKTGNGWIYVQSSALANLPSPGKRVSPSDAANMPTITIAESDKSAIWTGRGARHFRFVGIEIRPVQGQFVYNLVQIGRGEGAVGDLPRDITFDRCYIHGDPRAGGRRGVAMNGVRIAVIDSHVSGFKEVGADTQALWTHNTPGPLKIVNNYLEAAGENFMSGGADPKIANVVPSDIEIRGNHFFKPLAWMGESWSVKNLFELKSAQRVLVEGNVFENNWPAAQNGFAILLTPVNQDGKAPWSVVQDVTFRLNKLVNLGQGFNIAGGNRERSQGARRLLIEQNLLLVSRLREANGRIFQVIGGPTDVTIRHNTGLITVAGGTTAFSENVPKADRFVFHDNLLSNGQYGFAGTGSGPGLATIERHFSNASFMGNALVGGGGSYPPGNYFPVTPDAVGFVDLAGGNYRLGARSPLRKASTGGKAIGADIDAIEKAVQGAVRGRGAAP